MAKIKASSKVVRTKNVRITRKHLPTGAKKRSKKSQTSMEVGVIPFPLLTVPIDSPESTWIHRMKDLHPNGVRHFMRVLLAHGLYTYEDACKDFHENPEPFKMFFRSVGLETETENTLEVIQLKLVHGFKKVEKDLLENGLN